jgi:hypothetical protein
VVAGGGGVMFSLNDVAFLGGLQPPVPDPNFANVSLLLHGDGANGSTTIIDSSPSPKTVTAVGNAQISTLQSRFGGASIAFDGNGDRLTASLAAAIGTTDFTLESWVYLNNNNTTQPILCIGDAFFASGITVYVTSAGRFAVFSHNSVIAVGTTQTVSASAWTHLACTRSGGTMRLFVNGVQDGSVTNARNYTNTALRVGSELYNSAQGAEFNGYIDDLRITQGIARYQGPSFPVPTAPFPDA